MIHIIIVEPNHPGNVGAIARVIKNFGFSNLILVNPQINHLDQEAKNRAKHAQEILENAKVMKKLPKLHTLIATTSQVGKDYNIPRSPLAPEECASLVCDKQVDIGLVFGREGEGLSNTEIQECDFVMTIPTNHTYPTLNLSHSVAIVLYELFKRANEGESHPLATKEDKDQIMKLLEEALNSQDYATEDKKDTQRKVWRRMIGKSFLTKREAMALMGFMKKQCA